MNQLRLQPPMPGTRPHPPLAAERDAGCRCCSQPMTWWSKGLDHRRRSHSESRADTQARWAVRGMEAAVASRQQVVPAAAAVAARARQLAPPCAWRRAQPSQHLSI
eukprot:scaffold110628_cov30-Tisochrysis_lutea.AAC.7